MISRKFFSFYQIAAGTCDTATGLLLLLSPQLALKLMRIEQSPTEPIFISFIGSFVLAVGLTYLLFARRPRTQAQLGGLRAAWLITGVKRLCVGCFVALAIVSRQMEAGWFSIPLVDLSLGIFQLLGLRRNWLEGLV